jgi:hypothetical protein
VDFRVIVDLPALIALRLGALSHLLSDQWG